jgi:hypothetical protein
MIKIYIQYQIFDEKLYIRIYKNKKYIFSIIQWRSNQWIDDRVDESVIGVMD